MASERLIEDHRAGKRVVAVVAVCLFMLAGCSIGNASTCADLQDLAAEVRGLQDVNLVQTGLSGLEEQTDAIEKAWEKAKESGAAQFGSELVALDRAFTALRSTLTHATDSGDSIGEVITQVETDVQQLAASWRDLTSAVESELGDCDLGS